MAADITNKLVASQSVLSTKFLLLPSTTSAASSTGVNDGSGAVATSGVIAGVGAYTSCSVLLDVTAATGTSPTLNVYIQRLLGDDTTWCDVVAFSQATTTGKQEVSLSLGTSNPLAPTDATLAAGSVRAGLLGQTWRVKWVIGGTNPSFTFDINTEFFQ